MPTVTGPLHCDAATGTIAKQLTFQRTKRGYRVVTRSFPGSANPTTPTTKQYAVRIMNQTLMQRWPNLTDEQRATWNPPAAERNESPINTYLRVNFKLLREAQPATPTWPPPPPTMPVTLTVWEMSYNPSYIRASWTSTGLPADYYAELRYKNTPPGNPIDGAKIVSYHYTAPNETYQHFLDNTPPDGYYWIVTREHVNSAVLACGAAYHISH